MKRKEILFGLITALFLALAISPFASQWPDGLEKVAQDKGFLEKGEAGPIFSSPIPDYSWPGLKSDKLAASIAGVFGTLLVFGAGYVIAFLARRRQA